MNQLFEAVYSLFRRRKKRSTKIKSYEYGRYLVWPTDPDFLRAKTRAIDGIPDPRCFFLQSVIRTLGDVPGDVGECGVRYGKSAAFMLEADRQDRTYHLFDSFSGLSGPTERDITGTNATAHWSKGNLTAPEGIAASNLGDFDNVRLYRGWIPSRFDEVEDRVFALLHVDVDLYEPTIESLRFFWPRLTPGGVVVCDDYGSSKCPGARAAVDEFAMAERVKVLEIPTGQALIRRPG